MSPLERREARLRQPVSNHAGVWAVTLGFSLLLAGGCIPWGAFQ